MSADRRGELVRSGVRAAIVGPPNVGKSSILNYLAGRKAAIVSAIPGTTRDAIEVILDIAGYKVAHSHQVWMISRGDSRGWSDYALQTHKADQLMPSDKQLQSAGTIALAQPQCRSQIKA